MFNNKSTHINHSGKSQEASNNASETQQLIFFRITVLSLGEVQHFGWWKSQFLSTTGLNFLDRVFPRTKFAAAVRSALRVAQLSHDVSIGRGEVTHLFRAPQVEETVEDVLSNNDEQIHQYFSSKLNNKDELLQLLSSMANGVSWPKQSGPIRLSRTQWNDIHMLASIYLQGFVNKTPVYPYLVD